MLSRNIIEAKYEVAKEILERIKEKYQERLMKRDRVIDEEDSTNLKELACDMQDMYLETVIQRGDSRTVRGEQVAYLQKNILDYLSMFDNSNIQKVGRKDYRELRGDLRRFTLKALNPRNIIGFWQELNFERSCYVKSLDIVELQKSMEVMEYITEPGRLRKEKRLNDIAFYSGIAAVFGSPFLANLGAEYANFGFALGVSLLITSVMKDFYDSFRATTAEALKKTIRQDEARRYQNGR